jgi:hypothetical protein
MAEWWECLREALRGRYVCALEEEIALGRAEVTRLREENRALLNSVLGTAGVPPIETPALHPVNVPAVRRRSWSQIATTREIEAAREARARVQGTTPAGLRQG